MWYSRQGVVSFGCTFALHDFPYDRQDCPIAFNSYIYGNNQLYYQFTQNTVPPDDYNVIQPPVLIAPDFKISQFEVIGISTKRQLRVIWGFEYGFLVYTLSIKRFPQYYISNAIFPSYLITCVSVLALWIDDIGIRLSVAITGLLAIIAVGWTVQSSIPISGDSTWLGEVTGMCGAFVFCVCIESILVAFMSTKKGKVPRWVKFIVLVSIPSKWYRLFQYYVRPVIRKNDESVQSKQTADSDSSLFGMEMDSFEHKNPLRSTGKDPDSDDDPDYDEYLQSPSTSSSSNSNGTRANSAIDAVSRGSSLAFPELTRRSTAEVNETDSQKNDLAHLSALKHKGEKHYDDISWPRAKRAIDRFTRVLLLFVFIIVSAAYLRSPPSRFF